MLVVCEVLVCAAVEAGAGVVETPEAAGVPCSALEEAVAEE